MRFLTQLPLSYPPSLFIRHTTTTDLAILRRSISFPDFSIGSTSNDFNHPRANTLVASKMESHKEVKESKDNDKKPKEKGNEDEAEEVKEKKDKKNSKEPKEKEKKKKKDKDGESENKEGDAKEKDEDGEPKEKEKKKKKNDVGSLKQKLEKMDAKIEAMLAKKADILKQIKEAEEAQVAEKPSEESNAGAA